MSKPALSYVNPDELSAVYELSDAGKEHEAFILCKLLIYQHPTHPNAGLVNYLASCAAYGLVFKSQAHQNHWMNEALTHSAAALAHAEVIPPPKQVHARWALRHATNLADGGYPKVSGSFADLAAGYARAALAENPDDPDALVCLAHALTPRRSKPRTLDEQLERLLAEKRLATTAADRWPLTKGEALH